MSAYVAGADDGPEHRRAPRVSIGLPVYNGERYLAETIRSLLAQDFTDFELIISDNGSTDSTPEICRSFAQRDSRVWYQRSPVNRGAAWNYNRLVHVSRGQYFKWAAHDDSYAPGFLSRCVSVLDERPDVSLCHTGAVDVDDNGGVMKVHPPLTYAGDPSPNERARDVMLNPSPCLEAFGLVRRRQLATTGLIGAYTSSDRTLILELALRGRFHQVQDHLFFHRQHSDRSVHRYRDGRSRKEWFDPAFAGRFSYPKWRLLAEYTRAISRAPVSGYERRRCIKHLISWTTSNRAVLVREVAARIKYAPELTRARRSLQNSLHPV